MFVALVPLGLWAGIGFYAWGQWRSRVIPNTLSMNLAKMAGASLMRLEAELDYPDRLETGRLIMFYDRLRDPGQDAGAMDQFLADLERKFGRPLRAKVFWVRGPSARLGFGSLSVHGLALGSREGHPDGLGLDRHELAHAALDQFRTPDADPPFLLHEGWADSQGRTGSAELAREALEAKSATPSISVRGLIGPDWYHRDDGAVYSFGGAFVDFLIRRRGVGPFVQLYNDCRPGTVEATFRDIYGTGLDTLEALFWEDVDRLGRKPSVATQ